MKKMKRKVGESLVWIAVCLAITLFWWVLIEFLWFCDDLGMTI